MNNARNTQPFNENDSKQNENRQHNKTGFISNNIIINTLLHKFGKRCYTNETKRQHNNNTQTNSHRHCHNRNRTIANAESTICVFVYLCVYNMCILTFKTAKRAVRDMRMICHCSILSGNSLLPNRYKHEHLYE